MCVCVCVRVCVCVCVSLYKGENTWAYLQFSRCTFTRFVLLWYRDQGVSSSICIPGGRNSSVGSVLGSLFCVMKCHGFKSPPSLQERGFFPLELTWFWAPFPQNSFG